MTPRRPLPDHALEQVTNARNTLMLQQERAQDALDEGEERLREGRVSSPWEALDLQTRALGRILRALAFAQRELERIEGMDQPPDVAAIRTLTRVQ